MVPPWNSCRYAGQPGWAAAGGGQDRILAVLRRQASDPRWRVREAVAIALQRFGRHDMAALLVEMRRWLEGDFLDQRAVVAALCEPALL